VIGWSLNNVPENSETASNIAATIENGNDKLMSSGWKISFSVPVLFPESVPMMSSNSSLTSKKGEHNKGPIRAPIPYVECMICMKGEVSFPHNSNK
jgi:hypothetical protein